MDKIRLIVSDMDGTLLNEKQELSSDTIKILIQAQQQGIGVVLASGRGLKDLISYGKQLELDQYPLRGYVTLNGLELYDSKRKCIEKQQRLTYADIITFNKISLKYQIPLIIFFEDTSYLLNSTSINKSYLVDNSWVENSNMDLIKKQDETKLLKIVLCGNEESIEYMLNHLDENIFNQYEISKVEKQWVEINPKGINKGYGLLKYLNQYQREPTIQELSQNLNIEKQNIIEAMQSTQSIASFQDVVGNDNQNELSLSDIVSLDPETLKHYHDHLDLKNAFDCLNQREKKVIQERYYQGYSQCEIADELFVSQAQISRIEKKALEKLHKKLV